MMLTADDIVTASGKFPARAMLADAIILMHCKDLATRLNRLMTSFGASRALTSGFRDSKTNARVGGAAHSAHLEGKAADIEDKDGRLAIFCLTHESLLATLGLWMENPLHTTGWVHVQSRPVPGARIFLP